MTIIAAISASRQGTAPLHLAAQIARSTGDKIVAAAVVERPWPPRDDPVEDEYLGYVTSQARQSLERMVGKLPAELDTWVVVHQSTSVPTGLTDLAAEIGAELVVVGSSSSGLLGRVALGSVTGRLVHTAAVPVAIAPRGYPMWPDPIQPATAVVRRRGRRRRPHRRPAPSWPNGGRSRLRIVSFTVRPVTVFGGSIEPSAEDLVIQQWSRRTFDDIAKQLNAVRDRISVPDVDVVVGTGHDWREAVEDVPWETGDMLLLGSGAAGQAAQVFLGSAASKILRHAPSP